MQECLVAGCGKKVLAKGVCAGHYYRRARGMSDEKERFPFDHHLSNVYTEPNTGCWLWPGAVNTNGYGLGNRDGVQRLAHRLSYEKANGPIPDDLNVLHRCDVPSCVNPDHLFIGTQADNMQDMTKKGRHGTNLRKLSDGQVVSIRSDQRSHQAIADEYGIARSTISQIKSGRRYKTLKLVPFVSNLG